MAAKTADNKESSAQSQAAGSESKAKAADLVSEIGTLTYPRAVEHFGKENALHAMREVARLGGHGEFDDAQLMSPLFGGLAMPSPDKILPPNEKDFAHLPDSSFYYKAALEDHENMKVRAGEDRENINTFFNSLK